MAFRAVPINDPYEGSYWGPSYGSTGGRPWIATDLLIERDRGLYNTDPIFDVERYADRTELPITAGPFPMERLPVEIDAPPVEPEIFDGRQYMAEQASAPDSPQLASAGKPLLIAVGLLAAVVWVASK